MTKEFTTDKTFQLEYGVPFKELSAECQTAAINHYNTLFTDCFQKNLDDLIDDIGLEKTYDVMNQYGLPEDLGILGEIIINDGAPLSPYTEITSASFTGNLQELISDECKREDAIEAISAAILKDYKGLKNYLTNEYPQAEMNNWEMTSFDKNGNILLSKDTASITVYQIKKSDDLHDGCFLGYDKLLKLEHRHPRKADYALAYQAIVKLPEKYSHKSLCEMIYADSQFGLIPKQNYGCHSISVSDVLEVTVGDDPRSSRYFFCDSIGFREVNNQFIDKKALAGQKTPAAR